MSIVVEREDKCGGNSRFFSNLEKSACDCLQNKKEMDVDDGRKEKLTGEEDSLERSRQRNKNVDDHQNQGEGLSS